MVKNPAASAGDKRDGLNFWVGEIPWSQGMANPLQYSCLENPIDRGS